MFGGTALSLPDVGDLIFRASEFEYSDNVDLDSAVAHDPALGPGWRVADWTNLVGYSWHHPVQEIINSLHWAVRDSMSGSSIDTTTFWIRYLGRTTLPADPRRHYFVARWDHNPPSWYKIHADLDNKLLVVGSWYGWNFRVLGVKKGEDTK